MVTDYDVIDNVSVNTRNNMASLSSPQSSQECIVRYLATMHDFFFIWRHSRPPPKRQDSDELYLRVSVDLGEQLFGHRKSLDNLWDNHKKSHTGEQPDVDSDFWRTKELLKLCVPPLYKMPTGLASFSVNRVKKKIRPSSAAANLQTYPGYSSGLYDTSVRPATASTSVSYLSKRPATQAGGPRRPWQQRPTTESRGEKDIVKQPRRLTLGAVDGIAEAEALIRPGLPHGTAAHQLKSKIEEKINIDTLEELKRAFQLADVDRTGCLQLSEFKQLLKSQLSLSPNKEQQIDALFMKIDWASEGSITWDEFCTYMQLEYAEKEDSYLRAKEVAFHLPARIENLPHRDPVLRITDTSDGTFVACSQDGMVSFWSANADLKRTRSVVNSDVNTRQKPKWITDFVIMPHFNKFIVGTGDREIQFFELSSFEPYCQISGLETVPLKLDYSSTGYDECLILYGDSQGCVNILVIKSAGECLRTWKKMPRQDGFIASISLDVVAGCPNVQFIRWYVHGDWVQQIKYYHEIGQVISCSNHSATALVIGCTVGSTHVEQQLKEVKELGQDKSKQKAVYAYLNTKSRLDADKSVFKVYKGVKCFNFSKDKNIMITGGMDRIIRLWNPYVSGKPTAMLRGHNAPIFYLFIAEEDDRIFSVSTDRCIKVWDIQDHNCLLTVRPKGHKIRGDLQAIHYSTVSKALAIATDQMSCLGLRLRPVLHADIVISHKEPVTCCKYNPSFKQVVTASDGSVIKLWDFETGMAIFDYGEAHGDSAITTMSFDSTGRRLITGGRDGILRIWNYNNGHCLKMLKKEEGNEEVCDVTYIEMNRNRYVVAVGWDRRINIYYDSHSDSNIHHVQHPAPYWHDDLTNGHKEDILAVAQCLPNLLATASYDGETIVWNMVSGHIFCHLLAPPPPKYEDQSLDGDLSINALVFLQTRAYKKECASLVASGPRAHIHMWNVFQGGKLMAQFPGSKMPGAMVSTMQTTKNNIALYTGDSFGFIYIWNMDGYCADGIEQNPPELIKSWRGHVSSLTCLELVEDYNVVLTGSVDCAVRMWTMDGEYIGTFGQPDPWDLYNPSTYQHPMVPYDVLIDPMSLPTHPLLAEKQTTHEVIHMDSAKGSDDESDGGHSPTPLIVPFGKQQFYIDDETIAKQLKEKPLNATGKRLRHEKLKPVKIDRGGPSEYRMLRTYNLADTPQPNPPTFKVNKDNPFDFYID
ncbi:WD repeat-containing protein on Y chromosome-like [Gigantopelta aegis]|uniref:WD repeat-containing protein on Y chromosome-like n=1 Tax=Gigantopelta aegis TaxID=1735272 RepID=UPI001B8888BA|nr:WD repeat-containing protein on Y chromosome-like [Gigantopelta aegis]